MFIKLTRLDNAPIWFNASLIVTVEPRKGGGTTVVPVGDGLDYDVREKAEDVIKLLEAAPAPCVIPVPSGDSLAPAPADVSPDDDPIREGRPERPAEAKNPVPVQKKPAQEKEKPAVEQKNSAPEQKKSHRRRGRRKGNGVVDRAGLEPTT
ncbi:MAG: flagellar FlbD family protein [Kiritimatiellae bacterium]|nr:flagellar FlbD family protein [Kiritimatiellia bacterium]